MEFVEGKSLRKTIQQGPLPVAEVLRIASEAASGLAAAHEHGVIHRDVKSENIMLTPDGSAKIMDFGLAQVRGQSRLWKSGETVGTVSYMSPEQARGEHLDERTDIWSLGVVMYEMLTGKLPFPGEYESAVLYLIIHEQPHPIKTIRDDVPTKLQEIVSKCLEKDCDRRYRKATELLTDVNALQKQLEGGIEEPSEKLVEEKRFETERRPVTVIHAAIVSSSTEDLDPEALTAGLDECIDGLIGTIEKYDGMADRVVGDKLMAVFGAPIAHENDPERAIRCAHEMMSYVLRVTALGMSQASTAPQLKIGIHTGVVIAGNVGAAGKSGYSIVGDAINVAAGIVDVVAAGKISLSADAYKLVAGMVEVEEPRMIALKGKTHEMKIFDLRSLKFGAEGERMTVGGGAFVGRTEEIKAFDDAIERIHRNTEVRLFIRGEAGVGKTRLKNELVARADRRHMSIIEGKCSSFEINTPYYLWNTFLKSLLRVEADTPESEIRSRLHEMVKVLSLESDEPYLASLLSLRSEEILLEEDEERKAKMYSAAKRLLNAYAERKRTVFIFEDLHWIDRFSQALLDFVLQEEHLAPALILCLFRPEYRQAHSLRIPGTQFDLDRLPAVQAYELMRVRLNAESVPGQLARFIEERSEGNPFFIEEIIKTMLDKGIVSVKKGKLEMQAEKLESGVPDTLQGVILARIDQLEGRIRELLLNASVIGREFSRPVLEHVIQKRIDVGAGLKKLESLELVFEKEEARELEYLFKHYLIQEVAYNTLLQKKRKQLHGMIARAIEKLYPERLKEFYEILAFHYEKAEEWEQAADYLSRAGNKMREFYTKEESKGFSERTNAVKARLVEGKGVKTRVLFVYRLVFGVLFLEMFLLPLIGVYLLITSPDPHALSEIAILLVLSLFYLVISIWGGLRFFQVLRARPRAFELFEDHIEIIFNDGTSRTLDFSDIHIFHFYEDEGARFRWRVFVEEMYLPYRLGLRRSQERINPASFGFGSKKGEIHIRRKSGLSFYSKDSALRPWRYNVLGQRDLSLTPSNPDEFYEQLVVAFEKWRMAQADAGKPPTNLSYWQAGTTSAKPSYGPVLGKEPLLKVRPVFKILAVMSTLNLGWYFMAFIFPLLWIVAIAGGGYREFAGNYFLILWNVFLSSMLFFYLLFPLLIRKRMTEKYAFEFFPDSVRVSIAGGITGARIISYADIISVELVNKRIHRIFNVGGILIKTNTVTLINEATRLAETVLIILDVPDAGKIVERIIEIVDTFKQREGG
jgi:class 3 adenylate cyclase